MPMLTIVPVYTALLALMLLFLSVRVIMARWKFRVALGDGGNLDLQRRIRVHANFVEFVPFCLLLLAFYENMQGLAWLIHLLCVGLVLGRISHAYGVSQEKEILRFRQIGVVATFAVLLIVAVLVLFSGLRIWLGDWLMRVSQPM